MVKIAECERSGSEIHFSSVPFVSQKCSTFKITLIVGLLLVCRHFFVKNSASEKHYHILLKFKNLPFS